MLNLGLIHSQEVNGGDSGREVNEFFGTISTHISTESSLRKILLKKQGLEESTAECLVPNAYDAEHHAFEESGYNRIWNHK